MAAIGIYGLMAYSVQQRTQELGVRMALGAQAANLRNMVLRQGMTLTGIGILFGLFGAVLASQVIVSLLYGVSRFDPITHLFVIALLIVRPWGILGTPEA